MYFYICIVFWKQKNKLWHTQFNFGISNTDNSNTTMYVCGSGDFYYISDFLKKNGMSNMEISNNPLISK